MASEWGTFIKKFKYTRTINYNTHYNDVIYWILKLGSQFLSLDKPRAIAISIESGIQNATVGITIGNIISPMSDGLSILSLTSGVYGILMYIVCLPCIYIFFSRK